MDNPDWDLWSEKMNSAWDEKNRNDLLVKLEKNDQMEAIQYIDFLEKLVKHYENRY